MKHLMKHLLTAALARFQQTAALHPWAKAMIDVLKKVHPKVDPMLGTSDGEYVAKALGERMIQALEAAGYKKHGSTVAKGLNFEGKPGARYGISVSSDQDFPGEYVFLFYDEDM